MITIKVTALGAVLVSTIAANPDCQGPDGGAGGNPGAPKACDLRVRSGPWVYGMGDTQRISASVHVECDTVPKQHSLEVWLERDVTASGNWLIQLDRRANAKNPNRSATLPDKSGFDVTATYQGCISGKWRVMAKAVGASADGVPFRFDLPESETRPTALNCTM